MKESQFLLPGLQRTFTGGCYDPIVRSPTLHAPCMANRHCEHMPHTRCSDREAIQ